MNKKLNKSKLFTRVVLPIILVVALVLIAVFSLGGSKNLSKKAASEKAETFINNFLMQSGTTATIKGISTEYGLYKLEVDIVSDVVDSYMSKDGKLFFPQALEIEGIEEEDNTGSTSGEGDPAPENVPTSKKPNVELFIMSYCPYGTQMQKGILPAVEALGDTIDFDLKFVDYIMHGEKEITENLVQYCVQEEEPKKLNDYLTCFLAEGKSDECLAENKISAKTISKCSAKADKKYDITKNYEDKVGYRGSYPGFDLDKEDATKYNVGGSPTLVINGQEIRSSRDSASLLNTICAGFDEAPEECDIALSSAAPSPGFGFGTAPAGSEASCN